MAAAIIVYGPAAISIASPAAGTLEALGYTRDGVEITEQPFLLDVHTDDNGGENGPPIDQQYLGEVHIVRMSLTKYDSAVAAKLQAGYAGLTVGSAGTPGTLLFQDTKYYRLLINASGGVRNYLGVVFREPKEHNRGTKFTSLNLVAHCYKVNGTFFNTSTS